MINDSLYNKLQERIVILEKNSIKEEKFDNLTTITIQDLQNRINLYENNNKDISRSDYINGFSLLLSLITALCLVGYYFYNLYQQRKINLRKILDGNWTTEGEMFLEIPTPFLNFKIEVDIDNGQFLGTLEKEEFPNGLIFFGVLKSKTVKVDIVHFTKDYTKFGTIQLTLEEKLLKWETISGNENLFPKSVVAWKK